MPPARPLIRKRGSAPNLDAANADLLSLFKMKMLENNNRREEERQQRAMERDDARKRWEETMTVEKMRIEREDKRNESFMKMMILLCTKGNTNVEN